MGADVVSNEPNAYDETGVLPNATREDGVLLWHCPNCLTARSVTAKRHEGSKVYQRIAIEGLDGSTAYVWSCGVCAHAWAKQNFILACNSNAELKIYTHDEVGILRDVAKASATYRRAELAHAAAVMRGEADQDKPPNAVHDAQREWRIVVDKMGKEVST